MLCEHGNVSPCVECDMEPLRAENEKLREKADVLAEALEHAIDRLEGAGLYYSAATVRCRKALATYRKGAES